MRETPRPIIRRHGLARALAETLGGAAVVLAETDAWLEVEGNVYFPPPRRWRGGAEYYGIVLAGGQVIRDAAWYHDDPYEGAEELESYVAFRTNKVKVEAKIVRGPIEISFPWSRYTR
ncbi:hypothetical protein N3K66_002128 [Trichothecium roseum]|uniref:Uncharacterized protein n=1 Tax=Trichothecium roseum TaxID=47278 RepID=A0ACC0V8R1_9HYPO|nr:hypothetical protein N3K66_002128 [Trichothecium roseum]